MQKLENKNRTVDIFHLSKQEMHGNRPFLFNSLGDILVLGVIFLVVFFFKHCSIETEVLEWTPGPG